MTSPENDVPFDACVLDQARDLVRWYKLTVEPTQSGGYMGSSVELPYVFARAETTDECLRRTLEALAVAVAALIEKDKRVPQPASQHKRELQVNVRLSANEKLLLEETARRDGFRSVSDFIRSVTLREARA